MYRGFNLTLADVDFPENSLKTGRQLLKAQKTTVESTIDSFFKNGVLDGSKMQANWFPQIQCDVFISHSHADLETAIGLAGWLEHQFGLKSFVDYCAWGYADDLLRIIDNKYCLTPDGAHYDYDLRNRSTSHVHMMLSAAISRMIDATECVFFLNTPASLTPSDTINRDKGNTGSPWIYAEIEMTRLVRIRSLAEHRGKRKLAKAINDSLTIKHTTDLRHLTSIGLETLRDWHLRRVLDNEATSSLDILYYIAPQGG